MAIVFAGRKLRERQTELERSGLQPIVERLGNFERRRLERLGLAAIERHERD